MAPRTKKTTAAPEEGTRILFDAGELKGRAGTVIGTVEEGTRVRMDATQEVVIVTDFPQAGAGSANSPQAEVEQE